MRGFKLGEYPFYDACLVQKEIYYLGLFSNVTYVEIDGMRVQEPPFNRQPEWWPGIDYDIEAPAEDLLVD